MSTFKWLVVMVIYTCFAAIIATLAWQGPLILLHIFNICLGVFNIFRVVDTGLRYGWK